MTLQMVTAISEQLVTEMAVNPGRSKMRQNLEVTWLNYHPFTFSTYYSNFTKRLIKVLVAMNLFVVHSSSCSNNRLV